ARQQHERRAQARDLGHDLVERHVRTAVKRKCAVAISTAEIAAGGADERTGQTGILRLTLDAGVDLRDPHGRPAGLSRGLILIEQRLWRAIVRSVYLKSCREPPRRVLRQRARESGVRAVFCAGRALFEELAGRGARAAPATSKRRFRPGLR